MLTPPLPFPVAEFGHVIGTVTGARLSGPMNRLARTFGPMAGGATSSGPADGLGHAIGPVVGRATSSGAVDGLDHGPRPQWIDWATSSSLVDLLGHDIETSGQIGPRSQPIDGKAPRRRPIGRRGPCRLSQSPSGLVLKVGHVIWPSGGKVATSSSPVGMCHVIDPHVARLGHIFGLGGRIGPRHPEKRELLFWALLYPSLELLQAPGVCEPSNL